MYWTIETENEWFVYFKCSECGFVDAVAKTSTQYGPYVICPKCKESSAPWLTESDDKEDVDDGK